jgi:hypothetical protein
MEWVQEYAQALSRTGGGGVGEVSLSQEEEEAVLLLARLVARGTERRNAPLATFVAGRFVDARVRQGVAPGQALAEAAAVAEDLLAGDDGTGRVAPAGQPST